MVRGIGADVHRAWPRFDRARFERLALARLDSLGLTGRAWEVAEALHTCLPPDFEQAAAILTRALGPELEKDELLGMGVFRHLPAVFWVSKYGLDHLETSLDFQYEVTKRFSAEYSIRFFVERHPEKTLARLRRWTRDPNVHVRRLVSEGTRPRLPWAPRLRLTQEHPEIGLGLLELLKDDPQLYVRRSVANHLNDISKDHPDLAAKTARAWLRGASEERRWVVRHALRDLVKKGHAGALAALGVGGEARVKARLISLSPRRVEIGGRLRFTVAVTSAGREPQDLLVDFAVHFVKASGKTAPKVFKLERRRLLRRETATLEGSVSLRQMTTRKHYPGRHRLELRINGRPFPLGAFEVVEE